MNLRPNRARITLTDAPANVDPAYKKAVNEMFEAARAESAGRDWSRLACDVASRQADWADRWNEMKNEKKDDR